MLKHLFLKSLFQVWFFTICFKPQIVLLFTSFWFYYRYLYDSSQVRQTTLAVFGISQHVLLKEFFISTTAILPASQSVYLLYKKKKKKTSQPISVSLLPSVTCWSAARWEQEGPLHLPVQNQTTAHLSDWPERPSSSLSLSCNSTPDGFCLCLN